MHLLVLDLVHTTPLPRLRRLVTKRRHILYRRGAPSGGCTVYCTGLHSTLYPTTLHSTLYPYHAAQYTVPLPRCTVHCTPTTLHSTLYPYHTVQCVLYIVERERGAAGAAASRGSSPSSTVWAPAAPWTRSRPSWRCCCDHVPHGAAAVITSLTALLL
jgi:hypothetical protein